ncbi:ubiquinol-cytochrome c reductase iron-sulfur subunit [Pusillimonas sp. CC-YST705]|uniref:Ubiquinol-cytochrome c reductase iron-sulfur subunit n=1 Tax=Mesopusillimonas faecipullorum TaxID=2755040 RepID=A0ABS8CC85_9BURK|nr:ubiquinol-cytochrome c reductase iron-sulfur subunit [Mesopusillimonas faecipullorum]MCB5363637.1 ubiquinol-cytochrome c reductase iron-sulfur subunit [Mesopusillimonas faecipullorum]
MGQEKLQLDGNSLGETALDANLPPDPSRRMWITTACAAGGVAGAATLVPFVGSFAPSDKARAAGAPVELNITDIPPGELRTVEWRGKPVWVLHRTPEQLATLSEDTADLADPDSTRPGYTPEFARNEYRSRKPEYFVAVGICTHLGCSPTPHLSTAGGPGLPPGWEGGFFCPCHGSAFDLAGRVFKNVPAPDNLEVPPYTFTADGSTVIIGVDEENKA